MVARRESEAAGRRRERDPLKGLFEAWRRLLTRVGRLSRRAIASVPESRPVVAARLILRYVVHPVPTLVSAGPAERERLKEGGAAALVLGAALSFALSGALGVSGLQAFLGVGWLAAWALARLLILRIAIPAPSQERRRVDDAWGPALWPYVFAVVFPLDIFALAASAVLTYRGLAALGFERPRTLRAVALAFGGQLAVEVAAWVGRAGLLAYVRL